MSLPCNDPARARRADFANRQSLGLFSFSALRRCLRRQSLLVMLELHEFTGPCWSFFVASTPGTEHSTSLVSVIIISKHCAGSPRGFNMRSIDLLRLLHFRTIASRTSRLRKWSSDLESEGPCISFKITPSYSCLSLLANAPRMLFTRSQQYLRNKACLCTKN